MYYGIMKIFELFQFFQLKIIRCSKKYFMNNKTGFQKIVYYDAGHSANFFLVFEILNIFDYFQRYISMALTKKPTFPRMVPKCYVSKGK